jgi:phosphoribosyl-AMP cyclohydrolase
MNWINDIKWDDKGLVPVIAQEHSTGDVLMFAWMNREAVQKTAELGRAVYFSRSRNKLWFKGEESGHVQTVHAMRMDCDGDVLLLTVTQQGHNPKDGESPLQSIACHTGRHSCFFNLLEAPQSANPEWKITAPVLKDPESIYK